MNSTKRNPIDRLIFNLTDKYFFEIVIAFILLASVFIRVYFTPNIELSKDYYACLDPWVQQYRELGFIKGLGTTIGNYYVPYNIILAIAAMLPMPSYVVISLASCLGDYVCAYYIFKILKKILTETGVRYAEKKAALIGLFVLYLPSVIINGSLWKQCDSIYTCFIIAAIYYLLSERYRKSFVLLSIGFVFKLQTILVIPFFLIYYIVKKRFTIFNFLWIPVMYIIAGIPAILCHRGFHSTYGVYFSQTGQYPFMTCGVPNIYNFGLYSYYEELSKPSILITIAVFIVFTLICVKYKDNFNNSLWLYLSGWTVMTCYMFLPSMHERYDFAAIIIIMSYCLAFDRKLLWTAVIMVFCSLINYAFCILDITGIPDAVTSIFYCLAYFSITADLIMKLAGKRGINSCWK